VQINHVVGMLVGHDHGIDPVSYRGVKEREKMGQRAVAQVEHHPVAVVLD